jgi:hypothetical protein
MTTAGGFDAWFEENYANYVLVNARLVAKAAWEAAEAAILTRAAGDTLATAVAKDILREGTDIVGVLADWLDGQGQLDKAVATRLKELREAVASVVEAAAPLITLAVWNPDDKLSVVVRHAAALIGVDVPTREQAIDWHIDTSRLLQPGSGTIPWPASPAYDLRPLLDEEAEAR